MQEHTLSVPGNSQRLCATHSLNRVSGQGPHVIPAAAVASGAVPFGEVSCARQWVLFL